MDKEYFSNDLKQKPLISLLTIAPFFVLQLWYKSRPTTAIWSWRLRIRVESASNLCVTSKNIGIISQPFIAAIIRSASRIAIRQMITAMSCQSRQESKPWTILISWPRSISDQSSYRLKRLRTWLISCDKNWQDSSSAKRTLRQRTRRSSQEW